MPRRGASSGSSTGTDPQLNSPYEYPARHWELDANRQPTNRIVERRRTVSFITPIPAARKQRAKQQEMVFDQAARALATDGQQYDLTAIIESVRHSVGEWRRLPRAQWRVTPETARLLEHWRHHQFSDIRPFFCQVEAVETVIWLTEVAPGPGREGRQFVQRLGAANEEANPGLARLALKLATGAGKTTVMAMLIAWQTINAVRHPGSRRFTRGFLVVTPGLTIRDRLRVLQPNDPDSYYQSRELVPRDLLGDLGRAKIVITNYHAFMPRETQEISRGGRALLQGRGPELRTLESEGQMLQRVMPGLMGMKQIMAFNDEAHHCYREQPEQGERRGQAHGRRPRGGQEEQRSRAGMDLRPGGGTAQVGAEPGDRSLGHAVLSARLRLRGGHPVPLDDERLLADGRNRVRHRQTAARAGGRQHPRRRHAQVPQPVGAHRQAHAPQGARQVRGARPAEHSRRAADRPRSPLRPLREDLRPVARSRHRGAALLHRRVQQHVNLETGLRLHFRVPAPA